MFEVRGLRRIPFDCAFEVWLGEVRSALLEGNIVSIAQERSTGDGSDRMQRTDAWAAACVEDRIRTFVRVVGLHVDKRQLDGPTLGLAAIFGHY